MTFCIFFVETANEELRKVQSNEGFLSGQSLLPDIATTTPRETFTCVCSKCPDNVCVSDYMVSSSFVYLHVVIMMDPRLNSGYMNVIAARVPNFSALFSFI